MLIYEYQINHMIRSSCLSYEIKKKEFKSRIKERISPCAGECILPLGAIACLPFRNAFLLHARLGYPLVIQHTVVMIMACLQTCMHKSI